LLNAATDPLNLIFRMHSRFNARFLQISDTLVFDFLPVSADIMTCYSIFTLN